MDMRLSVHVQLSKKKAKKTMTQIRSFIVTVLIVILIMCARTTAYQLSPNEAAGAWAAVIVCAVLLFTIGALDDKL